MSFGDSLISVNFSEPFPLFPLNATMLMPHGIVPLRIFEPRYKQMVAHVLGEQTANGGTKQFAMATFRGEQWMHEYHGRPAIRPVVCLGQIMQHMEFEDGTYAVVLQGLCRATVVEELAPDEDILYRRAILRPVDVDAPDEDRLVPFRESITEAMESDRLADLRGAAGILEHLRNNEIPTSVLIEVLGFQFLSDPEMRYRLLASDDATERADIVRHELMDVQRLLRKARPQREMETVKGCCWN